MPFVLEPYLSGAWPIDRNQENALMSPRSTLGDVIGHERLLTPLKDPATFPSGSNFRLRHRD